MRRLAVLMTLGLVVTAAPAVATGPSAPPQERVGPEFVAMPCPDFFPPHRDVDCGFVRVPEDRSQPHGRMITVAAAVLRATVEDPEPDPIVFLDGGPSFGAISDFATRGYFAGWGFARRRDVILVDTRGTGLSEPRLGCPELDQAQVDAFNAPPTIGAQSLRIHRRALTACWDRLVDEGVDPAAYTSAESAADLEALRRALGVRSWNLLAVSADGVVGATYVRLFPDHVRSVVFDSTMAPQAEWGPDYDRGWNRLLEKIFRGCRANADCRATYPHVRRRFYRQIARLQAHPAIISFPDFRPHPVTLELDGVGVYADAVFEIGQGRNGYPPGVLAPLDYIWRVSHGGLKEVYREWFGHGPVTNEHTDDFLAQGKTLSYACHDLVAFVGKRDLRQAARDLPPLAPRYLNPGYDLALGFTSVVSPAGCRYWPVGRAPRWQHRPLTGDVPTLVLGGEFDMGMPPYVVRMIARRMTNASYVELPASGHLQLASFTNGHDCARQIAAAFLTDPGSTLDTSCLAEVPVADFTPVHSSSRSSPKSTVTVSKPLWRWAAAYPR